MRVLYTNKLESASSLTATTENYNFPLSNILVNQLAMTYKATDITVDITAVFDDAQTVNAIGIAGHNATKMVISYYTLSTDVTLHMLRHTTPCLVLTLDTLWHTAERRLSFVLKALRLSLLVPSS